MGRAEGLFSSITHIFLQLIDSQPLGTESRGNRSMPSIYGKIKRPLSFPACLVIAFASVFILYVSPPASAHERIGSYSHAVVTVTGSEVAYYLNLPPVVTSMLSENVGNDANDIADFFRTEFRLLTQGRDCPLAKMVQAPPLKSGNTIIELDFQCPVDVADLSITSSLFLDLDESHTQFVRLAPADDPKQVLHEAVLTESNMSFQITDVKTAGAASLERALAFLKLGIEHLLTGYDHILFLLTVIIGISFIESVKAVTSFTLAHSITMALAFLGAISLPPGIVEPLIAATVIFVAIENILRANVRRRWIWTFFFGLIHGLGFVDALKMVTVSQSELILSLVSFNIGIELGQLLILLLAAIVLYYLRHYTWHTKFNRGFSACVGLLGVVWLFQRIVLT